MTWFVLLLPLLVVAFIAAMMLLVPAVVAPTVPLGVSVPRAHITEPSIAAAVRHYRWGVVAAFIVSVAVTLALAAAAPIATVIVPVLLMIVISTVAYVLSRQRIQRAKRDGGWYDDVPVRVTARISASGRALVPLPWGWYLGALLVLAAAVAIGASSYGGLPDPMPVHWNSDGVADAYAPKSAMGVFGSPLTGVALVLFLFLIAQFARRAPMRGSAGDPPEVSIVRQAERQRAMQAFLGGMTLVMAGLFAGISVTSWYHPAGGRVIPLLSVGFLVVIFVLLARLMLRLRTVRRAATSAVPSDRRPTDAPDDDRYWKGGLVYVNRDDPALFVPKRFGVGWTVNAGHPVGIVIVAALVLLIVGVAVFVPLGVHPSSGW